MVDHDPVLSGVEDLAEKPNLFKLLFLTITFNGF
jgi:hypothetical protein